MRTIAIGLLGFGTVGVGVADGLRRNSDLIARRAGFRLSVGKIADLDWDTPRDITVEPTLTTKDSFSVVQDPGIDIVVELIGGVGVARELILAALDAGKPVVTANKALLARHGAELYRAAARNNVDLYFEASTGGCIPVVRAIREGLAGNRFTGLYGILNGTCNYILTRMESEQAPFDEVLREAQAMGYAEADPGLDIDGFDTAHKTVILASLLAGAPVDPDSLKVQGIRGLDPQDIFMAGVLGYRIKLLAHIEFEGQTPIAQVQPTLIPQDSLLAQVNHAFNAVMIKSDMAGNTLHYGRGAGREPTASAVIGDLIDIGRNLTHGCPRRVPPGIDGEQPLLEIESMAKVPTKHYMRVSHEPNDNAPARIRACLAESGIGIAAMVTRKTAAETATSLSTALVSEPANEHHLRDAIRRMNPAQAIASDPVLMTVKEGL